MVPEINLLPPLAKRKSSNLVVIIGALLIGLLLIVLCLQFFTLRNEIKVLEAQESQLVLERDVLSAELTSESAVQHGTHSTAVTFVETVSYPVSPLIDDIYSLIGANTYLRSYQFGETGILVSADFETMNEISSFIDRLLNSAYFSDVKVESVTTFEPVGEQGEETNEIDFDVQWRYSATIQLEIDKSFLSGGGNQDE